MTGRVSDQAYYGQWVNPTVVDAVVRKLGSQSLYASRGWPFDDVNRSCWRKIAMLPLVTPETIRWWQDSGEPLGVWTERVAKVAAARWKAGGHKFDAATQTFVAGPNPNEP